MAGGKLSPRQRMINLMYLVFIAMLALNMSKEVLSAFGLMNEKFEDSNTAQLSKNTAMLSGLEKKAGEDAGHFADSYAKSKQVAALSSEFYSYLESLKVGITKNFVNEEGKSHPSYEQMDKSTIDEEWIGGKGVTAKGKEILAAFEKYRTGMSALLKDPALKSQVETKFATSDEKDKDGNKVPFLQYHFAGFPAIATVAKLSAYQSDVKTIESEVYANYLGGALNEMAAVNENNYQAIVIPEKSAFFAGEQFKGKVVLGRYDSNTVPTSVEINGSKLDLNNAIQNGQVQLGFTTGNIGEHDITGKFTFKQDGKDVEIPIKGNYVVVPKPNTATIAADKMNVVYRGVDNPMTISFAGVNEDKVNASAPGLRKAGKGYVMTPGTGREVKITVNGTLPDGSPVSDNKVFRIKDVPKPTGTFLGKSEDIKLPKANIGVGEVKAEFEDFDFELPLVVTSFKVSVPGQPSINVTGNKMSAEAKSAINRARKGEMIQVFDIKAKPSNGANVAIKTVTPFTIEVAN